MKKGATGSQDSKKEIKCGNEGIGKRRRKGWVKCMGGGRRNAWFCGWGEEGGEMDGGVGTEKSANAEME